MIVPNGGREYAHFACEDVPPDATAPTLEDATGAPQTAEWWAGSGRSWDRILDALDVTQTDVDDGTVRVARILITTPEAGPPGALFLPGTTPAPLRFADTPEVVIRGAGTITVL